nr:putative ribonuclease H-like domain-containing protein [Tanacetum cinerariifolium]
MSQSNRPSAPLIKDWVSDSEDDFEGEPILIQKAPSFVQTTEHVKTPSPFVKTVEHPIPVDHLRKDIPKSKGHSNSRNRKACFVCKSLTYLIKDYPKGGKITCKGKIRTGKLGFDDVYFIKELKFNLFSISQMCDMKNSVLFTNTECIVLSSNFKLLDENHATLDESNLWHRRLGHINFKTMNKLVKGNLVRGLPSKVFENNHTCVACKKGKQHRAS